MRLLCYLIRHIEFYRSRLRQRNPHAKVRERVDGLVGVRWVSKGHVWIRTATSSYGQMGNKRIKRQCDLREGNMDVASEMGERVEGRFSKIGAI